MPDNKLNTEGVDLSVFKTKKLNTEGVDMSVFGEAKSADMQSESIVAVPESSPKNMSTQETEVDANTPVFSDNSIQGEVVRTSGEKALKKSIAQTPKEKEIYDKAISAVNQSYEGMGGFTPQQKMKKFNEAAGDIVRKYENDILYADSKEDLAKINSEYQSDVLKISDELGLEVTDDGSVKPYDREINQYIQTLGNQLRLVSSESEEKPDGYLNDLSDRLASGFSSFSANMVDLAGFLTGANYFEGYKNLSEGQRFRAEQFREQSKRYDDTIQELVENGDIGKATGLAVMSAVESLPAMIPMFANPSYGVYVMGAGAGMEKYRSVENEDVPMWNKISDSLITGMNEALWEKAVTVPILAKSKQAMASLGKRHGKDVIKNAVDASLKSSAYKTGGKLPSWVSEGLSEAATEFSNNIADKIYIDPETELDKGVFDAFTVGAIMGKAFDAPSSIVGMTDRKQQKDIAKKAINSIPKDMSLDNYMDLAVVLSQREAYSQAEFQLSEEFKGKYVPKIVELSDKANRIMEKEAEASGTNLEVGDVESDTGNQGKVDYLVDKGVKIPDGTTTEELNQLFEEEKSKEQVETKEDILPKETEVKDAKETKETINEPVPEEGVKGEEVGGDRVQGDELNKAEEVIPEEDITQKRQQRIKEIDDELGDVWSDLADIVGAKKSLTGEQRKKLAPTVQKVAKLYAEKYALKGLELVENVKEYFRNKGIELDDDIVNEGLKGIPVVEGGLVQAEDIIPAIEVGKAKEAYDKIIKDNNQTQESALDGAWKRITRTQWYKGLDKEQQQQAETEFKNVRSEQIVDPKRAIKRKTREKLPSQKPVKKKVTSKDKLTGKMVEKEVEVPLEKVVNEMQAIRDEIKLWTKQTREQKKFTEKEFGETVETVKTKIKEAVDNNFISRGQYKSIINRIGKATTDRRREKLFDYVDEVLEGSAYRGQVSRANKIINKVSKANKKAKSKFGTGKPLADEFSKIDPKEMSIEELRLFNRMSPRIMKGNVPNIGTLEAVLSRFKDRQKTKNKVERIKTEKELNEFIEGIGEEVSAVATVRDFMNVTRKMTMARNKAAKLRDEMVISEEAFNDINAKIGKNLEKKSEYEQELEAFKAEYADQIASNVRAVRPEIKESIKDMDKDIQTRILQFLSVSPKTLNKLRIIDIEGYDTVVENLRIGELTPQMMKLRHELEVIRNRESYVDKAIDNVSKSKLWTKFADRGFVGPKLRMWQVGREKLTNWKSVTGDNLLRFLMSTKGHRIDTRLGILDKVNTLNNGLVEISKALQKESNTKDKFQEQRVGMIDKFKKVHKKDFKDRMDKLGFFLLEKTWQNSKNYGELSKNNASLVESMFSLKAKEPLDKTLFETKKKQWRDMYAEAKEEGLLNKDGVLDIEKYDVFLRKDKATSELMDGIDSYLEGTKEMSRWATMEDGRTFIELDKYFPLRETESSRETTADNLQERLNGMSYRPKMQANSTYMREGVVRWTENDIFKVLEDHTNEVVRNFQVYPASRSVVDAIRKAGMEKAEQNIEATGDAKGIGLLADLYNKNIEDRLAMHYRIGNYSTRHKTAARIWGKILGGGKKVMLAVPARVPAEMGANVSRGTISIGEVPSQVLKMSKNDKGVYSSLLEEYMGDKYYSKYAPEVGTELAKNKYLKKAERGADWFIILSDKVAGKTLFVHEFNKQFQELTGEKFDPKKYSEDLDYYVENRDAIDKSATWGLRRYEELFNDKTAMTTPQLTTFLGGMVRAERQHVLTQTFDILQSFSRNEVDQIIDSIRRIRHGDENMQATGYRDLAAITISNFQYQTLRRAAGVVAASVGVALLGQEPTEYEEENKEELATIEELAKDWRQSAIGLTMGGSANVYAYSAKWAMYVLEKSGEISDEKKEAIYDILENDLYARRIAMGGTTESVVKTVVPLPSGITADVFELMDGGIALYSAIDAAFEGGHITKKERWEIINSINIGAKYFIPNPITPSLVKPIRRKKISVSNEGTSNNSRGRTNKKDTRSREVTTNNRR